MTTRGWRPTSNSRVGSWRRTGRFLARGLPVRVYEKGVVERTTLIEFPSATAAIGAYESDEYQAALRALGDGAVRDVRIIEAAGDNS